MKILNGIAMMRARAIVLAGVLLSFQMQLLAAPVIETVAGGGSGDGTVATGVGLDLPSGVVVDAAGNVYLADFYKNRIRKVDVATGNISTVAGTEIGGFSGDGGPSINAGLSTPSGLAIDTSGNLYIADSGNNCIRKVDAMTGIINTVAGNGSPDYSGDGGDAKNASMNFPSGVAIAPNGNLYIADQVNHRIRLVDATTGVISTVAGSGEESFSGDGGAATDAGLAFPAGVAVDSAGQLYIADSENNRVRKVDKLTGIISTIAGSAAGGFSGDGGAATNAAMNSPTSVAVDADGDFYIADRYNNRVRKVDAVTGNITTIAGIGGRNYSGDGGAATDAGLNLPLTVAIGANGDVYIADQYNYRIRAIDAATGFIRTVAGDGTPAYSGGDGGPATSAGLYDPFGVAVDSIGNMYIADAGHDRVRKVDMATGVISTVAGDGSAGFDGDGGMATSANLFRPWSVAIGANGDFYIADRSNRIRRVEASTGIISTVAGNGTAGFSGDGGPATNAALNTPISVALSATGDLLVADNLNNRIRRVDAASGIISTVAGNGSVGFGGDGGASTGAALAYPTGVAVDANGNVYFADENNRRVRKVDKTTGVISTVAGNGTPSFSGDGGPAISAGLILPYSVAIDATGDLYISDQSTSRVRKVDMTTGIISTVAGSATALLGDGGLATNAGLEEPAAIAFDATGNMYIADAGHDRIRKVSDQASQPTLPGAPNIGAAIAGNAQATVTFSPPTSEGGSPIAGYTVVAQPVGGIDMDAGSTSLSHVVSNLTNGTTYTFTVTATNSVGTGPASAQSNAVTPFAASSFAVDAVPNPTACNQNVVVTATVTGSSPTGTVNFDTGGMATCGIATLVNGIATCSTKGKFGDYIITGHYSGDANNVPSAASASESVSLGNSPPTVFLGSYSIKTGDTLQLNADGSDADVSCGDSIVSYEWDLNGDGDYHDATGVSPALSPSQLAALGLSLPGTHAITVHAIDTFGAVGVASGSLTIQGIPGAPMTVSVIAGDSQASVTFVAPADNGGSAIVSYTAIASPAGAVASCTAPCSSIIVPGLANGTAYTFTVFATNDVGDGPHSMPSNTVTPAAAVTAGIIETVAGNGTAGFGGDGGAAADASLSYPYRVAVDSSGNLYIADSENQRVRRVETATGLISTVAGNGTEGFSGDGGAATDADLSNPHGVALDANGNLYIADLGNHRIRRVDAATGLINTVAGNGTYGFSGDGGAATDASLRNPSDVAVDASGSLYVADWENQRIRKVDAATGLISTVAGNGTQGFGGDGGAAADANLSNPGGVALDANGNLYIADLANHRIRRADAATGLVNTVAGNGTYGFSGDGGAATDANLADPTGVTVDASGNLYIADTGNQRIRMVDAATGLISTVAGNGTYGFGGDGGAAIDASLRDAYGVAVDPSGNLYIADQANQRIRKVGAQGPQRHTPGAPVIGSAVAGNGQATVTFAPPASDGNSPIISYTARSAPGNLSATCAAPCTSITFPDLLTRTAYTFTITATNAIGTGPASAPSNAVIPTPAPQFTSASATTFVAKSPGSFVVVASGSPKPTLTRSGTLPAGVTFTPATGLLAGTPANGTVGTYTVSFTAKNGVAPDATQSFTLTVAKAAQTIAFGALPDITFGSPNFAVAAMATSALAVTFASQTPGVCTVTGRTVKLIAAGTCTIAADQAGNATYNPAPEVKQSFAVTMTGTTVTTISASKEPSVTGQPYTVSATVTSPAGVPKGSVTINDGHGGTCTDLTLSSAGVASCSLTSTAAGTLTLIATYAGSAGYSGSAGTSTHVVNQASTKTVVSSSARSALPGTLVTLSAKLTAVSPGKGIPTGTVNFDLDGTTLGSVMLDASGNASVSTDSLVIGAHQIVASYVGDANYAPSTSAMFTQTIVMLPILQFSVSAVTVAETVGSVTLTVTHSGSALGAANVSYKSIDGTAASPSDYGAVGGVLSWAAGDTAAKTITVPIVSDAVSEPIERFSVTLSAPSGATLGTRPTVTITIKAN